MSILTALEAALRAVSWKKTTPTSFWLSNVTYGPGAIVHHNGGVWIEVNSLGCKDSEPISGNTDWDLAGGTPYVDVTLDPTALTTTPFFDAAATGPGLVVIPDPGAGLIIVPTWADATWSSGTVWGDSPLMALNYGTTNGAGGGTTSLDPRAPANALDFSSQLSQSDTFNHLAYPIAHVPVVLYTQTDITDGGGGPGSQIGTQTLTIRIGYRLATAGA